MYNWKSLRGVYNKLHSFIHFSHRYSIFALLFTIVHSHNLTLLFTLLRNVTFQGVWATCDESDLVHKFKFQSRTTCDRHNKYLALKRDDEHSFVTRVWVLEFSFLPLTFCCCSLLFVCLECQPVWLWVWTMYHVWYKTC